MEGWRDTIESLYPQIRERREIDPVVFDEIVESLTDFRSGAGRSAAQ